MLFLLSMQVPLSKLKDSFNDGTSIAYIEELEQRYKADPSSVDKTWGMFFKALGERRAIDLEGSSSDDCCRHSCYSCGGPCGKQQLCWVCIAKQLWWVCIVDSCCNKT
jgi:hypothetical protein